MADRWPHIEVLGINRETVLRYLRLDDSQYYGGTTHDQAANLVPGAYGPHVYMTTAGMLDLIAQIANLPGAGTTRAYYSIQGAGSGMYGHQVISRQMSAQQLANILGCELDEIRAHYAQIVLVDEAAPDG